jgi:hypothetical protein
MKTLMAHAPITKTKKISPRKRSIDPAKALSAVSEVPNGTDTVKPSMQDKKSAIYRKKYVYLYAKIMPKMAQPSKTGPKGRPKATKTEPMNKTKNTPQESKGKLLIFSLNQGVFKALTLSSIVLKAYHELALVKKCINYLKK